MNNGCNEYSALSILEVLLNSEAVKKFILTMTSLLFVFAIVLIRLINLVQYHTINYPPIKLLFIASVLCIVVFSVYIVQFYNKVKQISLRVSIINSVRFSISGNPSNEDIERLKIYSKVVDNDSINSEDTELLKLLNEHELKKLRFSVGAYIDPIEFYILMLEKNVPSKYKIGVMIQVACLIVNILSFCFRLYVVPNDIVRYLLLISFISLGMCINIENTLDMLTMSAMKNSK